MQIQLSNSTVNPPFQPRLPKSWQTGKAVKILSPEGFCYFVSSSTPDSVHDIFADAATLLANAGAVR